MNGNHNLMWQELFEAIGTGMLWAAFICIVCFIALMALIWWDAKVNPIVDTIEDEPENKEQDQDDKVYRPDRRKRRN